MPAFPMKPWGCSICYRHNYYNYSLIRSISTASYLPILRPLAGHNKEEIINIANQIGTYEYSIAPHQDCCSFFLPLHPALKGQANKIEKIEKKINVDDLYEKAILEREVYETWKLSPGMLMESELY